MLAPLWCQWLFKKQVKKLNQLKRRSTEQFRIKESMGLLKGQICLARKSESQSVLGMSVFQRKEYWCWVEKGTVRNYICLRRWKIKKKLKIERFLLLLKRLEWVSLQDLCAPISSHREATEVFLSSISSSQASQNPAGMCLSSFSILQWDGAGFGTALLLKSWNEGVAMSSNLVNRVCWPSKEGITQPSPAAFW